MFGYQKEDFWDPIILQISNLETEFLNETDS